MFRESPLHKNAPLSAAVESDTVGYTTITMEAGHWYQIGNPFASLDGQTSVPINAIFNNGFESGDNMLIWDTTTATYLPPLFWVESKSAWCDSPVALIATPTDLQLSIGQAVYINKKVTSEFTFSGKVEACEVPFGREEGNAWDQIAPVWPVATPINDLVWSNLSSGDSLMILDSEKNTYLAPLFWVESKQAWCDSPVAFIATPSDYVLSPGQAIYINKTSAGKASVNVQ